jgi:hypothetical protein
LLLLLIFSHICGYKIFNKQQISNEKILFYCFLLTLLRKSLLRKRRPTTMRLADVLCSLSRDVIINPLPNNLFLQYIFFPPLPAAQIIYFFPNSLLFVVFNINANKKFTLPSSLKKLSESKQNKTTHKKMCLKRLFYNLLANTTHIIHSHPPPSLLHEYCVLNCLNNSLILPLCVV